MKAKEASPSRLLKLERAEKELDLCTKLSEGGGGCLKKKKKTQGVFLAPLSLFSVPVGLLGHTHAHILLRNTHTHTHKTTDKGSVLLWPPLPQRKALQSRPL